MAQKIGTVLFAGAGASRACGYALTNEILPRILERLKQPEFGDRHIGEHAAELRKFFALMVPGDGKQQDLPLITEILSIVDHCLASGEELLSSKVCNLSLSQIRWLIERAMAAVIQERIHEPEVKPSRIADWLLQRQNTKVGCAVLSTNYDASLDRPLLKRSLQPNFTDYDRTDFGFTWRDADGGALVPPSANPLVRLYKLHGSLNWLGCNRCGHVYVNFYGSIVELADGKGKWSECECGFQPLRAVLVAPSFVRQLRDRNLLGVWRSASEALRLADEWVFMGYSLPTEDIGIRALLLRALFSREKPPQVTVVSTSNKSEARYKLLFPDCRYSASGVRSFLDGKATWL